MTAMIARLINAYRLHRLADLLRHHQQAAEHHADMASRHRAAVLSITAEIRARSAK
jgi:hypothetical protein